MKCPRCGSEIKDGRLFCEKCGEEIRIVQDFEPEKLSHHIEEMHKIEHAADIAKGIPSAMDWDNEMSLARKNLDWEKMFSLAIDPEKARRYRAEAKPEKEDTCSMCGNFCAVKNMNRILDGEIVNIFEE